ncbi:SMP-30/gluconolactonase/LRE family protein [Caballeronia insecticola]|uniref:SMP-30/Gluconolaconase/LRE domain protein n=1 Tax=Caballeronia insecticola TaxID=758793 RepID=R4WS88_9BURK|nr:SMP-30/gluconolactonase/LRE family protein [Caballeronia insecticola]BAN27464.1 SMP-30/Gluconolaconase/LRE domain protein [Caballeronia insecticola]
MSSANRVERLDSGGRATVGECPVWRAEEGALYWVDIPARRIVRLEIANARRTEWTFAEQVACFAFDAAGHVVAGMESGMFGVNLQSLGDAHAIKLAAPEFPAPGMRFNDGRCDRQGRFWAGTMVQDMSLASPAGALYRFDETGRLSAPVVDGLITQNGLAWSPDGRTMYLSDSHPQRRLVWAFDFDPDTGTPSARRVFADLHHYTGRPDGAAVDADGCYWTCANDAGRLLRFTPQGKLDREIALPASKPSMCAFGGSDLSTLFVTTIRPASNATEDDGYVFALNPGVQGLPEPHYAGMLPVA